MDKQELEGLRTQYKTLHGQAKAAADKWSGKDIPTTEAQQIDALLGQMDELKARITMGERLLGGDEFLKESTGPNAAHLGWRDAGPTEGLAPVDVKAWRELKVRTVEIDPIYRIAVPGEKTFRFHVPLAVQSKGYSDAFEAYIRRGKSELGPNDLKTLQVATDSAGGFLVPEDYHVELIRKIATNAVIRANSRVVSTSRDIAKWPKIQYTADDKYTSGVRFTWTGESPSSATAHRVTDPVFGEYAIPIHTAMASMPLSNDLIEDAAFDVVGISQDMLSEAFSLGEDDVFLNGSGVGRPMGILAQVDGDGPVSVKSGTASTLTADGIVDLVYAFPSQYERNLKMYMNKATEKIIRKMKDNDDNYIWPVVPTVGNFGMASRDLLNVPVIREEFMPDVNTNTYPILEGDLNGYLILDRAGFSLQRLSELYAETNVTLLLARKRVGGQCIEPWRMRVQKCAA